MKRIDWRTAAAGTLVGVFGGFAVSETLEERVEKLEEQVKVLAATELILNDQYFEEKIWNVARFARLRNAVCRGTLLIAGADPDQMPEVVDMCEDQMDAGLERDVERLRSTGGSDP
ncbi:hypothetical protein [Candidatus Palauibacter sp.]|uniref:hypothetical protein n=1 Tax=Candidatus Palauibacter sp. TaxID=3101350 RepID=UPI003B51E011